MKYSDALKTPAGQLDKERDDFVRGLKSRNHRFVFVLATDENGRVWFDVQPDCEPKIEGDVTAFKAAQWALAQLRRHADQLLIQAAKEDESR